MAEWFDTHDIADYQDEFKTVQAKFVSATPATRAQETLVLRLSKAWKDKLKATAKNRGLNASSLARMWLIEKLKNSTNP